MTTTGPLQVIAVEFETIDRLKGEIVEELDRLVPTGSVRLIDAIFVAREENGDLVALEMSDLGGEDDDNELGTFLGLLLGFSFDGDANPPLPGVEDRSPVGFSAADLERIGDGLPAGTGALLLMIEHLWAIDLRDAVVDAGGRMVAQGFLTPDTVLLLGAELTATVDALDAIETAEAAEALATLKALEAAATIELATAVETAVVARTVQTLVAAGIIDELAIEDAIDAVVDTVALEEALSSNNR